MANIRTRPTRTSPVIAERTFTFEPHTSGAESTRCMHILEMIYKCIIILIQVTPMGISSLKEFVLARFCQTYSSEDMKEEAVTTACCSAGDIPDISSSERLCTVFISGRLSCFSKEICLTLYNFYLFITAFTLYTILNRLSWLADTLRVCGLPDPLKISQIFSSGGTSSRCRFVFRCRLQYAISLLAWSLAALRSSRKIKPLVRNCSVHLSRKTITAWGSRILLDLFSKLSITFSVRILLSWAAIDDLPCSLQPSESELGNMKSASGFC